MTFERIFEIGLRYLEFFGGVTLLYIDLIFHYWLIVPIIFVYQYGECKLDNKHWFVCSYFSPGLEEIDYVPEGTNTLYGIVLYQASDCMPFPNCQTYGPFSNPQKMLHTLDKLE